MLKSINKFFFYLVFFILIITSCVNEDVSTDKVRPEITLIGDSYVEVYLGEVYIELGARAYDDVDKDISNKIVISGDVDVNTEGEYIIHYNVSDSGGNEAITVTRTVSVISNLIIYPQAQNLEINETSGLMSGYAAISVRLSKKLDTDLLINLSFSGTATEGMDYYFSREHHNNIIVNSNDIQSFLIPSGDIYPTQNNGVHSFPYITLNQDYFIENNENIIINFSYTINGIEVNRQIIFTIIDDNFELFSTNSHLEIIWGKYYYSTTTDIQHTMEVMEEIIINNDETFLLAGERWNASSSNMGSFFVKIDSDGNQIWQNADWTIEELESVELTAENNYLITGYQHANFTGRGYQTLLDQNGNRICSSGTGFNGRIFNRDATQLSSGQIWSVGFNRDCSGCNGIDEAFISKASSSCSINPFNMFGGSGNDRLKHIFELNDGNLLLFGSTNSSDGDVTSNVDGSNDVWIIKFNPNSNSIIWEKTYGENYGAWDIDAIKTLDGNFLVRTDFYKNGERGQYLFKIDFNGDKLWEKIYYINNIEIYNIQETENGNIFFVGRTWEVDINDHKSFIMKFNSYGNKLWEETFDDRNSPSQIQTIKSLGNDQYLLGGSAKIYHDGDIWTDFWLLKVFID